MYPAPFHYYRPGSLQEAILMLSELGEGAKPLAGGQSLIPLLKLRMDEPSDLVDIGRLPDLRYASRDDGWVRIGALSTHGWIAKSDISAAIPIIKDCASGIADAQVRSRGTIGGSVSSADPSCDWPALLYTLDAEIVCTGPNGARVVPVQDFAQDAYTTILEQGELVTEIRFKEPQVGSGGAYIAFKRAAPAFPVVSVGVQLLLADVDRCKDLRIVLGGAGPKPRRATEAEALLRDKPLSERTLEQAAEAAIAAAQPTSDVRGTPEYKRVLLRGLFLRAARTAVRRCTEKLIAGSHIYV